MPLFHTRGTDHLISVSTGIHEIKIDLELRISAFAIQSTLSITRKWIVHVTNGIVHIGSRIRSCTSLKSR